MKLDARFYRGERRTGENVGVDSGELDVRLCRVCDDEAVDDALAYRLAHRMPQQVLHDHGQRPGVDVVVGRAHVGEYGLAQLRQRDAVRRSTHGVCSIAVHLALERGGSVLDGEVVYGGAAAGDGAWVVRALETGDALSQEGDLALLL